MDVPGIGKVGIGGQQVCGSAFLYRLLKRFVNEQYASLELYFTYAQNVQTYFLGVV